LLVEVSPLTRIDADFIRLDPTSPTAEVAMRG
jgi:hypothetical protein